MSIPDSEDFETGLGEKKPGLRQILIKFLPYFPFLLGFALVGLGIGYVYLRYAHSIYETKARIVINQSTADKDKNEGVVRISLDNQGNTSLEKEIEVMRSKESLTTVVKKLALYAVIIQKGRFVTHALYGQGSPVRIYSAHPDSIQQYVTVPIRINPGSKELSFGGHSYPFNKQVSTPYGRLTFDYNPAVPVNNKEQLFMQLVPPREYAQQLVSAIRIIPKSKESEILDVYLKDEIPERAIHTLGSMIHVYDSLTYTKQRRSAQDVIAFIDQRLRLVADELSGVEKELQSYKSTMGISSLPAEGQVYFGKVQELDRQVALIDNQSKILDQVETYIQARNSGTRNIPAIVELSSPGLTGLLSQLFLNEAELEKVENLSGPNNPQVIYLKQRLEKLRPAVIESIQNIRNSYRISRKNYEDQISRSDVQLKNVPEKERKLLDITRRQEVKNAIYTYLLQKREETAVSSAANNLSTQILEKAENIGLVSPVYSSVYIICLLGGLGLALLIMYVRESLNSTVSSLNEIQTLVGAPVIGEISQISHKEELKVIVVGKDSRTIISEQFRDLRTNLNYLSINEVKKVVLVTSSIVSEGKSFVSLNTAVSLTLTGKKVLLMELDLRKPRLSKQLKLSNSVGISNFLLGENTLSEIIKPVLGIENLFLASSGPIPPNPTELILSQQMKILIEAVKADFDYVIIDSPPVGIVTDAKLLAQFASSTIFVVRHEVTELEMLPMIYNLYTKKLLPHIGIVFNGIKTNSFMRYGTYYGYKSKYAYGYVDEEESKPGLWSRLLGRS